jgi:hypothetical protein
VVVDRSREVRGVAAVVSRHVRFVVNEHSPRANKRTPEEHWNVAWAVRLQNANCVAFLRVLAVRFSRLVVALKPLAGPQLHGSALSITHCEMKCRH